MLLLQHHLYEACVVAILSTKLKAFPLEIGVILLSNAWYPWPCMTSRRVENSAWLAPQPRLKLIEPAKIVFSGSRYTLIAAVW